MQDIAHARCSWWSIIDCLFTEQLAWAVFTEWQKFSLRLFCKHKNVFRHLQTTVLCIQCVCEISIGFRNRHKRNGRMLPLAKPMLDVALQLHVAVDKLFSFTWRQPYVEWIEKPPVHARISEWCNRSTLSIIFFSKKWDARVFELVRRCSFSCTYSCARVLRTRLAHASCLHLLGSYEKKTNYCKYVMCLCALMRLVFRIFLCLHDMTLKITQVGNADSAIFAEDFFRTFIHP